MISLTEKIKKLADLSRQLDQSFAMLKIWPNAFDNGSKCKLIYTTKYIAKVKYHVPYKAHLENDSGDKFTLSAQQFLTLSSKTFSIDLTTIWGK